MDIRRILIGAIIGTVPLFASVPAFAAVQYVDGGLYYNQASASDACEAARVANGWTEYCTFTTLSPFYSGIAMRSFMVERWEAGNQVRYTHSYDHNNQGNCPEGTDLNATTGECESPPPVVCTAGQSISWGGASTDTACSDGCLVTTVGVSIQLEDGGLWLGDWQQTGEQCTDQPPHTPHTPQVDLLGNNCVTNSKGDQLCVDKQAPNCGYVNGVYTCLDALPPGTCYVLSGGSYVCDSSSTTPPAPNNGTPGTKANPDLKMQIAAAGASTEYFGVDTVGASSGSVDSSGNYTPGASGPAAGGSTSTSGSGSGETETATPATPGDFPALGGEGTGPGTVAANLGQLGTALFGPGSMYDTVTNVGLNTPAGSCPTASFEFQTTTFTIDAHCSLYESVAPTLQLVFSAIWALSAVVVVMRA